MDKAAVQIATKGSNMEFWHGRVDFSAHEIRKIIESCYEESNRRAPLPAQPKWDIDTVIHYYTDLGPKRLTEKINAAIAAAQQQTGEKK
jgi:hypothetical protein